MEKKSLEKISTNSVASCWASTTRRSCSLKARNFIAPLNFNLVKQGQTRLNAVWNMVQLVKVIWCFHRAPASSASRVLNSKSERQTCPTVFIASQIWVEFFEKGEGQWWEKIVWSSSTSGVCFRYCVSRLIVKWEWNRIIFPTLPNFHRTRSLLAKCSPWAHSRSTRETEGGQGGKFLEKHFPQCFWPSSGVVFPETKVGETAKLRYRSARGEPLS